MQHTNRTDLIETVLRDTIPMYDRMIHGKDRRQFYEAPQPYDVHGRVSINQLIPGNANLQAGDQCH